MGREQEAGVLPVLPARGIRTGEVAYAGSTWRHQSRDKGSCHHYPAAAQHKPRVASNGWAISGTDRAIHFTPATQHQGAWPVSKPQFVDKSVASLGSPLRNRRRLEQDATENSVVGEQSERLSGFEEATANWKYQDCEIKHLPFPYPAAIACRRPANSALIPLNGLFPLTLS